MKQIIFSIIAIVLLFSVNACNSNSQSENTKNDTLVVTVDSISANTIQVYYFHGSIRCHTCVSVDENTHQYLKDLFPQKIDEGDIIYKSINIDENERPDLVEKYQIYAQTLLFIKGDKVIDETEDAFQYVTTNPEKWKQIIEDRIFDLIN